MATGSFVKTNDYVTESISCRLLDVYVMNEIGFFESKEFLTTFRLRAKITQSCGSISKKSVPSAVEEMKMNWFSNTKHSIFLVFLLKKIYLKPVVQSSSIILVSFAQRQIYIEFIPIENMIRCDVLWNRPHVFAVIVEIRNVTVSDAEFTYRLK